MNRKILLPRDASGEPVNRGMGLPKIERQRALGRSDVWVPLFELDTSALGNRVFQGISVKNPSNVRTVYLGYSEELDESEVIECIECDTSETLTFDNLLFGPGTEDDTSGKRAVYIWGKIDSETGTFAEATVDFTSSGNPSDEQTINVNGYTYEFSSDSSKDPSVDFLVEIAGTAADTYQNLADKMAEVDPDFRSSISGTVLTLTSNYAGTYGNSLTISDGDTGSTITSFAGASDDGVKVSVHIW